jgi:hypothetical protein
MCNQEDETIDHLLLLCVFARQCWYHLLRQVSLHSLAPDPIDYIFDDWWESVVMNTSGLIKKGLESLIALGAWIIWDNQNICVFDGDNPNMGEALILARQEHHYWMMAGA